MFFKNKNKQKIIIKTGLGINILILVALIFFIYLEITNPTILSLKISKEEKPIKPDDDIVITFNQPMRRKTVEENFSITPKTKGSLEWGFLNQILKFSPFIPFELDTKYDIQIKKAESVLGVSTSLNTSFSTIPTPRIIYVTPKSNSQNIDPNVKKISIKLNNGAQNFDYKFSLTPKSDFDIEQNSEKTQFNLNLRKPLEKNTLYTLTVRVSYRGKKESPSKIIYEGSFSTASPLQIIKTTPDNNSIVSEFQNISVTFNKDAEQSEAEKNFVITPATSGDFIWQDKTMTFYPYKLDLDTEYKVTIKKGISSSDGSYTTEDRTFNFKVGPKPAKEPLRMPVPQTEAILKTGKYIDINIAVQTMTIFQDGKMLGAYLISTGKKSMPTPLGEFKVRSKTLRAYSKKYGLYMPFWMAFTSTGYGIHELPEWPGGYKEGANHLGIPVSHGCVRLGVGPAEIVYNFADIGTPVMIHK